MNNNPKLAALASAAMLLGSTATALADHDYRNDRNSGARYDYAKVISSRPIIDYVTVKTPVRKCWQETEYYTVNRRNYGTGAGTLVGALIGGVVGHQIGSGHGNDAATVAGAVIGAAIGNGAAHRRYGNRAVVEQHSRPVERCQTTYHERREQRIDGYRVTYRYNGQKYMTEMPYDPGHKLRIRVDVRPAS